MQTPLVPKGVWDEKGAGIPLQSGSHDRREHSADAAHRTHVPHFVENERKENANKERLPLQMITGTEPALFRHRSTRKRVLPSPKSSQRAVRRGRAH